MLLPNSTLVIATRNRGKVHEFETLFAPYQINVQSLLDFTDLPHIEETGDTFVANALLKAQMIATYLHIPVLADDSGLCVAALGGAPGVRSARYAGEHATDAMNNQKLHEELAKVLVPSDLSQLTASLQDEDKFSFVSHAYFACALVLVDALGQAIVQAQGTCHGYIIDQSIGSHGFGYDPVFYVPQLHKTMAQCVPQEKNQYSHRAMALQSFFEQWNKMH
jgi:XTP/dITP diphosphohydrolase